MRPWFLERFEHVQPGGDERWRMTCPLCGRRRNLSIVAGDSIRWASSSVERWASSRWVAKCFAGCDVKHTLSAVDLVPDDLLFENERRSTDGRGGGGQTSTVNEPRPGPGVTSCENSEVDEPELRALLRRRDEGEIAAVPVRMPALPPETPALARLVFEDMALRWGLRLAALEDRPLPYATSEAVLAGLTTDKRHASRAIRWLERQGLIWSPGALAPRGKPDGTRTFLPGARPAGAVPEETCRVEAAAGVLGTVGVEEPHVKAVDEIGVRDAVGAGGRRLVAIAGGAVGEEASRGRHGVGQRTSGVGGNGVNSLGVA